MNNDFDKIEDKLYSVKYTTDKESHLVVNTIKCSECPDKICTYICPANVYNFDDNELVVNYENCLECGACRIACPKKAINWNYPKGSFGVTYKQG